MGSFLGKVMAELSLRREARERVSRVGSSGVTKNMEDRPRRMRKACVFLISGCLNKTPHTRWLKQQQMCLSTVVDAGYSHDQGAIRLVSDEGSYLVLCHSCLLTAHKDSPLCSCGRDRRKTGTETETEMTLPPLIRTPILS